MAAVQVVGSTTEQAPVVGASMAKPGWMLPLPKQDRGKGFLPVRGRGPLREGNSERAVDVGAPIESFAEQLADAAFHGGEATSQMRERLEQAGLHADHVEDLLRAGGELAERRAVDQAKLEAWAGYPETTEGRVAVHNARGSRRGTLTAQQWTALLQAYAHRCAYCTAAPKVLTIEHVLPVSRGGRTELGNVAPSCGACNRLKRTKTAKEWLGEGYAAFRVKLDLATAYAREVSQ